MHNTVRKQFVVEIRGVKVFIDLDIVLDDSNHVADVIYRKCREVDPHRNTPVFPALADVAG